MQIHAQYVWAGDYQNDMILRDRNADASTGTGSYGKSSSGLEERLYTQHDANWDVTSVVDTSTAVKERFTYTPYGAVTTMDGSWTTYNDSTTYQWEYKFQGVRHESAGDFYFMGARLYSPGLGRFLQQDPSGYADGASLYLSFKSAPVEHADPSGLQSSDMPEIDLRPPPTVDDTASPPNLDFYILYSKLPKGANNWSVSQVNTISMTFSRGDSAVADIGMEVFDVNDVQKPSKAAGMDGPFVEDHIDWRPSATIQYFKPDKGLSFDWINCKNHAVLDFYMIGDLLVLDRATQKYRIYDPRTYPVGGWRGFFDWWDYLDSRGWHHSPKDQRTLIPEIEAEKNTRDSKHPDLRPIDAVVPKTGSRPVLVITHDETVNEVRGFGGTWDWSDELVFRANGQEKDFSWCGGNLKKPF